MEWIDVNDRLPELTIDKNIADYITSETCVVLLKGKDPEVAYLNAGIGEGETWQNWYCPQADDVVFGVTHWMPLPKAPEQ